jgi:excisionase family DNA binding protein
MSSVDQSSNSSLLTLSEAADYLGLGRDHKDPISCVRYLIRSRQLRAVKIGKTWRIRRSWLEEFIESAATKPVCTSSRPSEAR